MMRLVRAGRLVLQPEDSGRVGGVAAVVHKHKRLSHHPKFHRSQDCILRTTCGARIKDQRSTRSGLDRAQNESVIVCLNSNTEPKVVR